MPTERNEYDYPVPPREYRRSSGCHWLMDETLQMFILRWRPDGHFWAAPNAYDPHGETMIDTKGWYYVQAIDMPSLTERKEAMLEGGRVFS